MEEVEVAPPEPLGIRVKVVSTSVCRSDVTAWQSKVRSFFLLLFAGGLKCQVS